MPVKIVAFVTPKPGREAELETVVRTLVAGSRTEPGNLCYDAWREQDGEGRLVIDELYVDHDAVEAHRVSDHYRTFRAAAADLLAAPPVVTVAEAVDADV